MSLRLLVFVGLAAGAALGGRCGVQLLRAAPAHGVAALPAVPFLEALALGYRAAAADLCWMQAVQYYGEHRQGGNDLSEFGHYLDAVNTLDPRYEHAYILGSIVLATDAHDFAAARRVLLRGAAANPESHRFAFHLGFLAYVTTGDLEMALRYFEQAARFPAGRDRAQRFAAFLNRRLGNLQTAWAMWNDLYRNSDDESLRIVALESMRRIEAELGKQIGKPIGKQKP
jgi:tetratricopeptide (TPR) repeat protein